MNAVVPFKSECDLHRPLNAGGRQSALMPGTRPQTAAKKEIILNSKFKINIPPFGFEKETVTMRSAPKTVKQSFKIY